MSHKVKIYDVFYNYSAMQVPDMAADGEPV